MTDEHGRIMDPISWATAIAKIGGEYAVIFCLLALLGYLAFQGVPAVVNLTMAINTSTNQAQSRQAQLVNMEGEVITNQHLLVDADAAMKTEHEELLAEIRKDNATTRELEKQICINAAKSPYQAQQCLTK